LSDGTLYGTFCAAGFTADNDLTKRDKALMEVLASAAATIIEPGVQERRRDASIRSRLQPIFDAGGPRIVLQPIVALADGARVGVEALSRFPAEWFQAPDEVFADAALIGDGLELEMLAVRRAADAFVGVSGYLSINFSAQTLLDVRCQDLLNSLPLERVVLELSEHDPVLDYRVLLEALAPLRRNGLRLAIDDVGAGFASLRHILLTSPDVIKLDRSIVAGASVDPILRRLVHSLTEFGHDAGASVVAEGVETRDDAVALRDAGVDYGQGWHFARPGTAAQLEDSYQIDEVLV
jgi:EAL domain-containing protein (putative c-di-GMP-specific phosphodiesterase class I)